MKKGMKGILATLSIYTSYECFLFRVARFLIKDIFFLVPATTELEAVPSSLNALDSHRKKRTNKGWLSNLFSPPSSFYALPFQLPYFAPFPEHSDSHNFKSAPRS
jgi:hypothetical protein